MADFSWWTRLSALGRYLTVIVGCGVILSVGFAIAIGVILSNRGSCDNETAQSPDEGSPSVMAFTSDTCDTPSCIYAASNILRNMNASVNPCDDFYKFACGNFLKRTIMPDDKAIVNKISIIQDRIKVQLRASIDERFKSDDSKSTRLVKNLYKSCIDEKAIKKKGVAPLLTLVKELGGWPVLEGDNWNETNFDWMESVYKFRDVGLPTNFFIGFRIDNNLNQSDTRMIYIDQASLGLVKEFLADKLNHEISTAYQRYMIDIAVLLGAPMEVAEKELTESLEFEKALALISVSAEKRNSITHLYNPMTIKEMSLAYPSIPWKEYFNRLLAPKATVDDNEIVIVHVIEYIQNFEKLIETTPRRVQANYVMWRAVAELVAFLSEDIRTKQLEFETKITGTRSREARWEECVRVVSKRLAFCVSAMYIKKYFNEVVRKNALGMFEAIRDEFETVLEQVEWMDSKSKNYSLHKAAAISPYIGYPDELLNDKKVNEYYQSLDLNGDSYLDNILNFSRFSAEKSIDGLGKSYNKYNWTNSADVTQVTATYALLQNSIGIPAAILQEPFFNVHHPKYMNYGGIGFVIGHEITHGFFALGRYLDEHGDIDAWWTPSTEHNFSNQIECIINQFNNYIVPELGLNLNGVNTQNENIADSGGIKIAYSAYKKWASNNPEEKPLPGLDYTPQQLFWISLANTWCSKSRLEHIRYKIVESRYSPSEFRILGALSNTVDFAKDFQCSEGTKMNPKTKCVIW